MGQGLVFLWGTRNNLEVRRPDERVGLLVSSMSWLSLGLNVKTGKRIKHQIQHQRCAAWAA